jgi:glycosyltransferase involved in cell wall biosynthesis
MEPDRSGSDALKIIIFHGSLTAIGGAERIVLEQVLGLRRRGHEVSCYCATLDKKTCYPDLIAEVRPRRIVPFLPGRSWLAAALSLGLATVFAPLLALSLRGTDVIVGSNQAGAWIAYCVARLLKKPFVVYRSRPNRSNHRHVLRRENGRPRQRASIRVKRVPGKILTRFDRKSMQASSVVLAINRHLADRLQALYGREIGVCIAGSHSQSKRLLRLNLTEASDGAFKLGQQIIDKPYVLVTSSHEPESRLESILEVLARVKEEVPAAVLVITGPPTSHTSSMMRSAEQLKVDDRVVLTGEVSEADLQRLYREAAVYCHPEHYGGTGLGSMEAMAWGIPVVAWNHSATRVTIEDEKTGFLAEPNNVEAFANALAWLLQDPKLRRSLGAAGWKRAKRLFTWEQHARVLEEALWDALDRAVEAKLLADPTVQETAEEAGERRLPAYAIEAREWADAETEPLTME